jgi:hypothetical protein
MRGYPPGRYRLLLRPYTLLQETFLNDRAKNEPPDASEAIDANCLQF